MALQKLLFIDRDGTLIKEPPEDFQVDSFQKFALMENVIPALLKLKRLGYKFIMVTNQDGLGTDSFPKDTFDGPQQLLIDILKSQGINFEDVLICPHFDEDGCLCRKPKVEMLLPYLLRNDVDRNNSYVIGDRKTDLELAENAKLKGILFDSEKMNWQTIMEQFSTPNRHALVERNTHETKITVEVWLDQQGDNQISTGIGFFDHMLTQIAVHGGFRLYVKCDGDLYIDDHHTIEDVALALGEALNTALGDKIGITRYAFVLPMDECQSMCSLDLSGRPYLKYDVKFQYQMLNDMNSEMVEHFFRSLSYTLACTLHLSTNEGNGHHVAECTFKAFARCLKQAINVENDVLPSSKGVL